MNVKCSFFNCVRRLYEAPAWQVLLNNLTCLPEGGILLSSAFRCLPVSSSFHDCGVYSYLGPQARKRYLDDNCMVVSLYDFKTLLRGGDISQSLMTLY